MNKKALLRLTFLFALALAYRPANANQGVTPCAVGSLPVDIQKQLKRDFSSWKIQNADDLSRRARERWASEKPVTCPGIAVGLFESGNVRSYAILLVPSARTDGGYKLVVFSQREKEPLYTPTVADTLEQNGASNYFIHATPISKFFNAPSKRRFRAYTTDGILLVDSAENEYEVDVYFWSGGTYRHEPIDY